MFNPITLPNKTVSSEKPAQSVSGAKTIIICCGGDIEVFDQQADAERSLEARDVKRGGMRAYDAAGNELFLEVQLVPQRMRILGIGLPRTVERVALVGKAGQQNPDALKQALVEALSNPQLKANETRQALENLPLAELVRKASRFKTRR
jgi:hypothetical protein